MSTDEQLVRWAIKQRALYRAGRLHQNKVARLESIDEWNWGYGMEEQWQKRYLELHEFVVSNGRLPQPVDNDSLALWCQNQRSRYKRLPKNKITQLESEKCWKWELMDSAWNTTYLKMSEYIKEHGSVPSYKKADKRLWNWMNTQKSNLKKGILTEQRKILLDKLPQWVWGRDDEWMAIYNRVKCWLEHHDDLPTKHQDKQLAVWIKVQRVQKRKGKMSTHRESLMGLLNGWQWEVNAYKRRSDLDVRNEKWDQMFAAVDNFVEANGRLPSILDELPEQKRLGRWFSNQKSLITDGSITNQRKIKVESLSECKTKKGGIPEHLRRQSAIEIAQGIFSRAKERGRLPSYAWPDTQDKKDAQFIVRWKQAKHGTGKGRTAYYAEVEDVAAKFGFPHAFERINGYHRRSA